MENDVTLEGKICLLIAITERGESSLEVKLLKMTPYGVYVDDQDSEERGALTFFPWPSVSVIFEIDAQMRKDLDKRMAEAKKNLEAMQNGWRRFGNIN